MRRPPILVASMAVRRARLAPRMFRRPRHAPGVLLDGFSAYCECPAWHRLVLPRHARRDPQDAPRCLFAQRRRMNALIN